jgi:hypothetical protein
MAKSFNKGERVPYVTPFGVANFPHLITPDDRFLTQAGKPVYKTGLMLEGDALEAFTSKLQEVGKKLHGSTDFVLPIVEFYKDKTKAEVIGKGVRGKSVRKPLVFDAKRQSIPNLKSIGGGSIIRFAGIITPYESTEKVREGNSTRTQKVFGLTLYIDQVQIRKLVEGRSDEAVFEADEGGFEFDTADNAVFDADDATAF